MEKFSVCTSVYHNDKAEFVRVALDSMLIDQSVKPTEIVLVQDGPVTDSLSGLLSEYESKYPNQMHVIRLEKNKGLGNALRIGVENAKYDIVARMDSDDICQPDRFEKQLAYMSANPGCDIVGGQITEFVDSPDNIVAKREVPLRHDEIIRYMTRRCPLNHPTVMFRRQAVLDVGNYIDWFWNEDYYLWIRMMEHSCQFGNLPDTLVNMRSGFEQYSRRGGRKYYQSEKAIQKYMFEHGLISRGKYIRNVLIRWCVQMALPNRVRGWVFRVFFR